jgi:hypothetical protein
MKVFTKINLLAISVILAVLLVLLFTDRHFYKDDITSRKPLAVFDDVVFDDSENNSGESGKVYLIRLWRFDYSPDSDMPIENGGYFLSYTIGEGDYPAFYRTYGYDLRIIPENNRFRLERRASYRGYVSGGQEYYDDAIICSVFYFTGYSDDKNNLDAKIFEYYLKKNANTRKARRPARRPTAGLTNEDFRKMQQ